MTQHLNHFIEGGSFEASDGRRTNLINPVTEQVYGSAARGTAEDVNRAARKYLDPANIVIAVAGPMNVIKEHASPEERALLEPKR